MSVGLAKYRIRLTVKRTEQKAFILSTLDSSCRLEEPLQPFRIFVPEKGKYLQIFRATVKPVYIADPSLSPLKRAGTLRFYVLLLLSFRSQAFSLRSCSNVCRNEIFTTVFCHIYYVDIFNYEIPTFFFGLSTFSVDRTTRNERPCVR